MLRAVVGMAHGTSGIQSVIAPSVDLRIVVGPLGMLQLAVEGSINNHVAIHQGIVVHSIKTATHHFVGGVRAKQDTLPVRDILRRRVVVCIVLATGCQQKGKERKNRKLDVVFYHF